MNNRPSQDFTQRREGARKDMQSNHEEIKPRRTQRSPRQDKYDAEQFPTLIFVNFVSFVVNLDSFAPERLCERLSRAYAIEGCAAIDLDGGLSALRYQLSARIRWGHSLRRVQ
jgi:hypothetical protein